MTLYTFGKAVCKAVFKILFKLNVEGLENVPKDKNFLVVCNHKSNFDPPVLGVALPVKVHYMAKEELFKNKILGALFRALGAFPIKRGAKDTSAIRSALRFLNMGEVVAMFPEGGRSKTPGMLRRGKHGAAMIAAHSGVGILPVGISGEYKFRGALNIKIGEFIETNTHVTEKAPSEVYQEFTDNVIMPKIAELARVKVYENSNSR